MEIKVLLVEEKWEKTVKIQSQYINPLIHKHLSGREFTNEELESFWYKKKVEVKEEKTTIKKTIKK